MQGERGGIQGITHIAGMDVTIEGRYFRQRCAWCDAVLIDDDLTMVAVPVGQEGDCRTPWPAGRLVHNDGAVWWVLPEDADLPDDFCGAAALLTPEEFTDG